MTAQPDYLQQSKDRQAAYDRAYPDHCPRCQGVGVVVYPARIDVPEDADVCSCFEGGRCPRCGYQHTKEWMEENACYEIWPHPCDWCGFTGIEPGRPQVDPYPYYGWDEPISEGPLSTGGFFRP